MCAFACGHQLLGQLRAGREQTGTHVTQRNDTRASQSSHVDDCAWLEFGDIGQGIAQDQAPLGVRVQDFNGLATHAGYDIAWLDGATIRHVFARRNHCHHIDGRLQLANGLHGTQHAGCATHVELHFVHFGSGFDGNAARVKRDAFAHQRNRCLVLAAAVVADDDEPQRLLGTLRNGHKGPHTQLGDLFRAQHVHAHVLQFVQFLCRVGQHGWRGVVCGPVGPFFGQLDPAQHAAGLRQFGLDSGSVGLRHHQMLQRTWFALGQRGGVGISGFGKRQCRSPDATRSHVDKAREQQHLFHVRCAQSGRCCQTGLAHGHSRPIPRPYHHQPTSNAVAAQSGAGQFADSRFQLAGFDQFMYPFQHPGTGRANGDRGE